MTKRPLLAAAALLIAAPMLATSALAQNTPPPANTHEVPQTPQTPSASASEQDSRRAEMRERMVAADSNKDGQWSREEWLAAGRRERGFDMMDADKNNQLTRDEMRAGMEKMQSMRGSGRRGAEYRQGGKPE